MLQIEERLISTITVVDRARKELKNIESLKDDISRKGQLVPILITEEGRLIAGERRLTACKELGQDTIICRIMPDLATDDLLEIELMENVSRDDFLWHEELELKAKLHAYWSEQAQKNNIKWGYRETASKLSCGISSLSTDLTLASGIALVPELKDCDTKSQAKQMYKKLNETVASINTFDNLEEEEKKRLENLMNGHIPVEAEPKEITTALHEDLPPQLDTSEDPLPNEQREEVITKAKFDPIYAVEPLEEFIPKIPNNSVGFIELDPPYAINFDTLYGNIGKREATENDWSIEQLSAFYQTMLPILYDKLLDNSWIFCWTGMEHWQLGNRIALDAGFHIQAKPGIWVKPGGDSNTPKTTMISNYETFLLFRKGKATFNTPSFKSTIENNVTPGSKKIHQWEKPLDLYDKIFLSFSRPGSIFLSPFAGSGNSMITAARHDMMPMGCDLKQKYALNFYDRYQKYFI